MHDLKKQEDLSQKTAHKVPQGEQKTLSLIHGEFAKEIEARYLIEVAGEELSKVALQLAIDEKTLCKWIIKYKWQWVDKHQSKIKIAKQLIVHQNFNQKDVARLVGVSEKTMSVWAKKYKWKSQPMQEQSTPFEVDQFVKSFKEYIYNNHKQNFNYASSLINEYVTSINGEEV